MGIITMIRIAFLFRRVAALCVGVALVVGVDSAADQRQPVNPKVIQPTVEKLSENQVLRRPAEADPKHLSSWDYIVYAWVKCDANWDQNCVGDVKIEAPPGWQVCKAVYSETYKKANADYAFTPIDWYTNDSENPWRFRGLNLHIYAFGSHEPWDQWGSGVMLSQVGARLVPADYKNVDRYREGCWIPNN